MEAVELAQQTSPPPSVHARTRDRTYSNIDNDETPIQRVTRIALRTRKRVDEIDDHCNLVGKPASPATPVSAAREPTGLFGDVAELQAEMAQLRGTIGGPENLVQGTTATGIHAPLTRLLVLMSRQLEKTEEEHSRKARFDDWSRWLVRAVLGVVIVVFITGALAYLAGYHR
jgi:hypothetical protein